MNRSNINRPITTEDLIGRYNLDGLSSDVKLLKSTRGDLVKIEKELKDFVDKTTSNMKNIQNQVDEQITTWFYNYEPTLENEPCLSWTDFETKNSHIKDLFYNSDKGYVYVFSYDEGKNDFSWEKLEDKELINSMAIANKDLDTGDHKRTIFSPSPNVPYEVGDIWIKENDVMYRCTVTRQEGDNFHEEDWIIATDYSSEVASRNTIAQLSSYKTILNSKSVTYTLLGIDNEGIKLKVNTLEKVTTGQNQVFTDTPTVPYYVGDVYVKNENTPDEQVFVAQVDRTVGEYQESDFLYQPTYKDTALLDIKGNNIISEVSKKVGNDELATKISQTAEEIYIDALAQGKEGLFGWNSKNSSLSTDGTLEVVNGKFNGIIEIIDTGYRDSSKIILNGSSSSGTFESYINSGGYNFTIHSGNVNTNQRIGYSQVSHPDYGDFWTSYLFGRMNKTNSNIYNEYKLSPFDGLEITNYNRDTYGGTYCSLYSNQLNLTTRNDNQDVVSSSVVNSYYIDTPTLYYQRLVPTSLEEKKKDFEKFDNALDIIKSTDIYKYNYKDEEEGYKKHIGFVIGKDFKYSSEITALDKEGKECGADLYSFVSVCCKAIQEQQEQIEKLKEEIKELRN